MNPRVVYEGEYAGDPVRVVVENGSTFVEAQYGADCMGQPRWEMVRHDEYSVVLCRAIAELAGS